MRDKKKTKMKPQQFYGETVDLNHLTPTLTFPKSNAMVLYKINDISPHEQSKRCHHLWH